MTFPIRNKSRNQAGLSKRGWEFLGIVAVGLVIIVVTILLTFNLIDQTEENLAQIKSIRVEGLKARKIEEKEDESDVIVKMQVEKDLNAKQMSFEHYEMTDRSLKYVAKLEKLEKLNLSYTRISDQGLESLSKLGLFELQLCNTGITDEALKAIGKIKTLQVLNLSETHVSDRGLFRLADLKDLADFHISATNVTDRGMKEVAKHPNIWKLVLINTRITDGAIPSLATMPNLHTLHLDGTVVTAKGLKPLSGHKSFCKLSLQNCHINDDDVITIVKTLPQLVLLNLSRTQITSKSFPELAKLKHLEVLSLNYTTQISQADLVAFRAKMPRCKIIRDIL